MSRPRRRADQTGSHSSGGGGAGSGTGRPRVQPSAPPIHMMRDRSPPPRYEEAIAQPKDLGEGGAGAPMAPLAPPPPPPHQTSHDNEQQFNQNHRSQHSHRHANSLNRAQPQPQPLAQSRQARPPQSPGVRYRSASPGDLSDGAQERAEGAPSPRKGRGGGSKIKKGLESIAFFIIQILD